MLKKTLSLSIATALIGSSLPLALAATEDLPPSLNDQAPVTSNATSENPVSPTPSNAVSTPAAVTSPSPSDSKSPAGDTKSPKAFQDFADLKTDHPYYNAIIVLRYQGVVNGYADNTFHADQNLNRAEALKLIFEAYKVDFDGGVAPASFNDTKANAWYAGYLNRAVFLEVISGYADGTFRPEQPVNLVEFLKMLELVQKVDLTKTNLNQLAYADIMPGQWYTKYINYAKINDLVDHDKDNKVYPGKALTRGRAAEIIYRFRNLKNRPQSPTDSLINNSSNNSVSNYTAEKDYAVYVSASYKFAIQYPQKWFYSNLDNADQNAIRTYGFGPKDLATNPASVTLELLPEDKSFNPNLVYNTFKYSKEEGTDGQIKLSTMIDGSTRLYRLTGAAELEPTMLIMLGSLTTSIEGLETTPSPAPKEPTPVVEPAPQDTPTP